MSSCLVLPILHRSPPFHSTTHFTRLTRTSAARLYSTGPSGSNSGSHAASNLGKLAAGGAVAGFVGAFSFGWLNSPKSEARLDAVPCVDAIETYGRTWEPVHAKEQDDPKVCASCDSDDTSTSASTSAAVEDDENDPNWIYYPRDESEYYYSSPAAEDTGSSVLNVLMLRVSPLSSAP